MNKKPIVVVAGEPFGVFFELFFKAKKNKKFKNPIILIGSEKLLKAHMIKLNFKFNINLININIHNLKKLNNEDINLINVNFMFKKIFDKISDKSNKYISNQFNIALKILKNNECSGLINGPISKKNFLKKNFSGITEYLSSKISKKNFVSMLIYNKKLSVSPITTHLPLKDVANKITKKKIIQHIKLINKFYKEKFNKNPRIAVTGLNPHCESNYWSSEEERIINPSILYLKKKKITVEGPFPADTIFMKDQLKNFDVIVGMYHDQVLTPMKTLFNFNAINITLGLPYLRISPDHGPNHSMLGKNLSNPKSLIEALKFLDK